MTTASAPSLVVPMRLTALCVGSEDVNGANGYGTRNFAQIAADFSVLPWADAHGNAINTQANISEAALPELFGTVSNPLPPGIHLHWALPNALTHGTTDGSADVQFPAAPNRWLVVRIAINSATETPASGIKAWVIESDLLWDKESDPNPSIPQNLESLDVPVQSNPEAMPNKSWRAMGRLFDYETWQSARGGSYIRPHTVLGYGIAEYGATYAHCPNVFAFHDTLDDLNPDTFSSGAQVTYVVTGWSSNPADEPLTTITFPHDASYAQRADLLKNAYQWTFAPAETLPFPSATLCGGMITTIPWNPLTNYIQKRSPRPFQIAFGNTAAEALAALLAAQPCLSGLDHVERVLNALQTGQLQYLSNTGGLGQFDELLHASQFGSTASGHIWVVKRGEKVPNLPLPPHFDKGLGELNALQQIYDEAGFQLESLRSQLFADWYKYMILEYPPSSQPTFPLTADQAFDFLREQEMAAIHTQMQSRDAQSTSITSAAAALQAQLPEGYALTQIRAPRYWQATDPVVLVAGKDVQSPLPKVRGAVCRLSSSLVDSMTSNNGGYTVHASDLPPLPAANDSSFRNELQALLRDALFLDPDFAVQLSEAARAKGGQAGVEQIQAAQTAFLKKSGGGEISFSGIPPAQTEGAAWTPPWTPLIAQWEAYYYPNQPIAGGSGEAYAPDFITSNYLLDPDGIELEYQPGTPNPLPAPQIYRGTMVLSRGADIDIINQIDAYLTTYTDSAYAGELSRIRNDVTMPAVAQALGGFNQALAMRKQTLQLTVADPLAILSSFLRATFTNKDVKSAVGDQNRVAPLPENPYNPLRAGYMKLSRLRIVDGFGQIEDLVDISAAGGLILDPPILRAESLLPAGDDVNVISLPPRTAQPGRLLFRWLSAKDEIEMNSDPLTSPIFGWVLFNHVDDRLAIYDADGNALGSLNVQGPLWQGSPGDNATYNQPITEVFENANPHLRNFALGICKHPQPQSFIADLLRAIDRTVTLIQPPNHAEFSGISLLIGRPLALVRASLALDLKGSPAWDQSWEAFAATAESGDVNQRLSGGFPAVNFPVRLGDLSQVDDGLIGYSIDTGNGTNWETFYAAASDSPNHGVEPPAPDQLTLAFSSAAPVLVSLMMDPRAAVHATMGCFPVKQIRIPPQMFADALRRISVTFLTAPVLGTPARPLLPTPKENGYSWSWVTRTETGAWAVMDDLKPVDDTAGLADTPQQIDEGWLKLTRSA
jgi:hypothetical protein